MHVELLDFLNTKEVDIFISTHQTHLKQVINVFLSGFWLLRFDRTSTRAGGVAVVVRRNIDCRLMPNFQLKVIDAIVVEIRTSFGSITIIVTYCRKQASTYDDTSTLLRNELAKLIRRRSKYIVVGNLNAQHEVWGNQQWNRNGSILVKDLETEHCNILAPGSLTRISRSGVYSTLDIFLSKLAISEAPMVYKELSSDHYPVVLKLIATAETVASHLR